MLFVRNLIKSLCLSCLLTVCTSVNAEVPLLDDPEDLVNCISTDGRPMVPQLCELRRRIAPMEKENLSNCRYTNGRVMDSQTCEMWQLYWNKRITDALAAKESRERWAEKIKADKEAEQEKAEAARLTAEKQAEENKRNLQLQAQARQPFLNAQAKYSAIDARDLVMAPKVKADGKNYVVSNAYLEKSVSDRTFIASIAPIQAGYLGFNTRFVVLVPNNLLSKYQNNARVGGGFALIGKYIGNWELNLVNGSAVTVPVFEMLYLD